MTTGNGLLSAVDKWHEEGRQLWRQLRAERDELVMRLEEIDKRLAALPPDTGDPHSASPPKKAIVDHYQFPADASVPQIVSSILRAAETDLLASEIIERVQNARPDIKPEMVHSALYRLRERGTILSRGEKGSRQFVWAGHAA
jgi:hypothetical protein